MRSITMTQKVALTTASVVVRDEGLTVFQAVIHGTSEGHFSVGITYAKRVIPAKYGNWTGFTDTSVYAKPWEYFRQHSLNFYMPGEYWYSTAFPRVAIDTLYQVCARDFFERLAERSTYIVGEFSRMEEF